MLGTERAALWIQEETAPGDLVARASYGYAPDADPVADATVPRPRSRIKWLQRPHRAVRARAGGRRSDRGRPPTSGSRASSSLRCGSRAGASGRSPTSIGDLQLDDRQLRLLAGLAHQAKLALESADHYESLEHTFVSTVASLANALEANDAYTSSHARWISDMSLLVGRELGLDRDALKRLELGALFHDIGKIGIPSEILQKPGPLTDDEFEIIKSHPELGEKILAPIDRLAEVRPIVRACHERWDGQGYPDCKAGEEIPVESRIVLVCDAFHAMVTDRPYRGHLSAHEALAGCAGVGHPVRPRGRGGVRAPLRRRRGPPAGPGPGQPFAGSSAARTSRAHSRRFHSGTGVSQFAFGTKREC